MCKKCCANCSHYNDLQECRCPDSEHYEKYIPDTRGAVCSEHEYDEYKTVYKVRVRVEVLNEVKCDIIKPSKPTQPEMI